MPNNKHHTPNKPLEPLRTIKTETNATIKAMSEKNNTEDNRTLSEKRADAGRKGGSQKKTMTPAALEKQKNNAQKSTGPVTQEGKEASSRNAYIHGRYSEKTRAEHWANMGALTKPCKSTCPKYERCELVADGLTSPGQDCLDKQVFYEAFTSIMDSMQNSDGEYAHGLLAKISAEAIEVLHIMREHIAHKSPIIMQPIINKNGEVIVNPKTGEPYETPILNPVLDPYIKLLDKLGVDLPELMATPRAIAKDRTEKENGDKLVDLFSGLGDKFGTQKRKTFDEKGNEVA